MRGILVSAVFFFAAYGPGDDARAQSSELVQSADLAQSNELDYVSNSELKAEIKEREEDMKRTAARLADLGEQERIAEAELTGAKQDLQKIESASAARVRAFYRMSRNAGTLRYLLNADSPIDAIRRVQTLRQLLVDGLEQHREAGLRLAEAEKQVAVVKEGKEAAHAMLEMLTEAYRTRLAEARARRIPMRKFKGLLSRK